jgi:prevent-host-death family protein
MKPAEAAREMTFRNHLGDPVRATRLTASNAKKGFASVLEAAIKGEVVVITKHDAPKAVLISLEEYNALSQASHGALDTLSAEFDSLFAAMQTPKARRGMKTAFGASPKRLGKAAVKAARKRG